MFSMPVDYSLTRTYHEDQLKSLTSKPHMQRTTKKCSFDIASILKPTVNNSYMDDTEDTSSDDGQVQPKCSSPVSTYHVLPQTRAVDHCMSSCSSSFECESANWNRSAIKSSMSNGKIKSKRLRTIFTGEQLERLEAEFEKQQYMVGHERLRLARILDLSETQVKIWFQNRRIKWRRQTLETQLP